MLRYLPLLVNPGYWRKTWLDIKLTAQLMGDGRVPWYLKLMPVLVALYLISPLDLIPGFIPIIGQLDDVAMLLLGVGAFIRLAPDEVVADYRPELEDALS